MTSTLLRGFLATSAVGVVGTGYWGVNEFIRPKTILDRLRKDGYSFYSLDDPAELKNWKSLAGSYSRNQDSSHKFSDLSLGTSTTDDDARLIRERCIKCLNTSLSDDPDGSTMDKVKRWCVATNPMRE